MKITYHKSINPQGDEIPFPHGMLSSEIRRYLEDQGLAQNFYLVHCNYYYFFIHLDKGDRVDINLKL